MKGWRLQASKSLFLCLPSRGGHRVRELPISLVLKSEKTPAELPAQLAHLGVPLKCVDYILKWYFACFSKYLKDSLSEIMAETLNYITTARSVYLPPFKKIMVCTTIWSYWFQGDNR